MNFCRPTAGRIIVFVLLALATLFPAPVIAQTPQIPQIPAFLPTVDQVPTSQAMPLDGTWLISSLRKKIRIEAGRAFVIDGWTHMFVLNIQPGMVVIKDIVPTGPGTYQAEDLPLLGTWTARVQSDRSLSVTVATALLPVSYRLVPIQIDNPQWYAQEMKAAGLTPPAIKTKKTRLSFYITGWRRSAGARRHIRVRNRKF